jgi:hypothetical protein
MTEAPKCKTLGIPCPFDCQSSTKPDFCWTERMMPYVVQTAEEGLQKAVNLVIDGARNSFKEKDRENTVRALWNVALKRIPRIKS